MTTAAPPASTGTTGPTAHSRRRASSRSLSRGSGISLGISVVWLSLLVLLPLAAVLARAADYGWSSFWATISNDAVSAALRLTVLEALGVTLVNVVMGTLIAWVLVRDDFPGKAVIELVIDVPFALPTIVAGLVLLSLYGPESPLNLHFANTRVGIFIAQAINHANHHREQVCAVLTGFGIEPPDIQAWEYAWTHNRIWDLPESERPTA